MKRKCYTFAVFNNEKSEECDICNPFGLKGWQTLGGDLFQPATSLF